MSTDECRQVKVDGEIISVHGGEEMNAEDREMFAVIIMAARAKFEAERATESPATPVTEMESNHEA